MTAVACTSQYLVAACGDSVFVLDAHRLTVPCMGAEARPTLLWTLEDVGAVQGLRARPSPTPHMVAVTVTGHQVRIDLTTGRVLSRARLAGGVARVDAAFFGSMAGSEVVLTLDQDEPLHACLHEAQLGADVMAATPQPARFRRPPGYDEDDDRTSLFTLTLPGFITGAVEGESWLRSSCTTLHHYLAPARASASFKAKRACSIRVQGRLYAIEELELEDEATRLALTSAFHATVTDDSHKPPLTIQAPLTAVVEDSSSSSTRHLRFELPGAIGASALNPNSSHVVAGLANGGLIVLGVTQGQGDKGSEGTRE